MYIQETKILHDFFDTKIQFILRIQLDPDLFWIGHFFLSPKQYPPGAASETYFIIRSFYPSLFYTLSLLLLLRMIFF